MEVVLTASEPRKKKDISRPMELTAVHTEAEGSALPIVISTNNLIMKRSKFSIFALGRRSFQSKLAEGVNYQVYKNGSFLTEPGSCAWTDGSRFQR